MLKCSFGKNNFEHGVYATIVGLICAYIPQECRIFLSSEGITKVNVDAKSKASQKQSRRSEAGARE